MNTKTKQQKHSLPHSNQHSEMQYAQNWIELSASALEHNARQFQQWLGPTTQIAGVIKSNAYGHGLVEIATLYEQCKHIAALCVINLSEALIIRQAGIKKAIFVIGYLDMPYDEIIKHDIQVTIYDKDIADQLNKIGEKHQKQIQVHIKFDTGMSRLGIVASDIESFIHYINTLPWISIVGIFSHLAESYNEQKTNLQENVFQQSTLIKQYQIHLSNSHGVLTLQHKNYNFARVGIGLFGYLQRHSLEKQQMLKPVLSIKSRILQIKQVKAGALIGYEGLFQAPTDMTIAVIAMGYYEGIDARLSNCGFILVNDHFAPIIGRVCMNLTIIDISKISNCKTGQTVTILGKEENSSISAYDWSALTKASVYNHLTKLSATLPKIIVP